MAVRHITTRASKQASEIYDQDRAVIDALGSKQYIVTYYAVSAKKRAIKKLVTQRRKIARRSEILIIHRGAKRRAVVK